MAVRTWGFSRAEWAHARSLLAALLVEAASSRTTVTYGEVARRVFNGRVSARSGALMDLLGEVDTEAFADRGIMIASLVVRADSGMPGEGYFIFAEEALGHRIDDRAGFWRTEAERVWSTYVAEEEGQQ